MSVSAPRPRLPTWPGHGPAASSCRAAPPPSQAAVRSPTAPTLSDKSSPKLNVILCGVLAANQIIQQRGGGGADDDYGAVHSGVHVQPGGGEGRTERRVYCAAQALGKEIEWLVQCGAGVRSGCRGTARLHFLLNKSFKKILLKDIPTSLKLTQNLT